MRPSISHSSATGNINSSNDSLSYEKQNIFFAPEGSYKCKDVYQFDVMAKGSKGTQLSSTILKSHFILESSQETTLNIENIKENLLKGPSQYIHLPISSESSLSSTTQSAALRKRSKSPSNKSSKLSSSVTNTNQNNSASGSTDNVSNDKATTLTTINSVNNIPKISGDSDYTTTISYLPTVNASASPNSKNTQIVSSILVHDQLALILSYKKPEHQYFFTQIGRTFMWLELQGIVRDPLSCIHFKESVVTCHDVNDMVKDRLETILGLSTGEVLFYSPLSAKFRVMNKQGIMNKSAVTHVKWIPGSESLFMASFQDGRVFILDKDKDDHILDFDVNISSSNSFTISKPSKPQKYNPQTCWTFGKQAISAFSFSPDCQHVAITSMNGHLYVIDYIHEKLYDVYSSYFGGLLTVAWSPDGRFIVTGGQDDLITVYHFRGKVMARGEAHYSWVKHVAFDPYLCTDRIYRFGSVGEDGRLVIWEFSLGSLRKLRQSTIKRNRTSNNETAPILSSDPIHHKFLGRKQVATIQPLCAHKIHTQPLSFIHFKENCVLTCDHSGMIKVWTRPIEEVDYKQKIHQSQQSLQQET